MKQNCTIGRKSGYTRISCKLFLLFLIAASAILFANTALAKDTAQVKKVLEIKSSSAQQFEQPSNFTVDTKGNIYILDDLKERVLVYDKDGNYLFNFGSETNKVNLYKSYSIASDDYNSIHLFDPYENAIVLFGSDGKLKKTISLRFDDQLRHKITDLIFSYNNYYLIDNENSYLYIFDTNGHIVKRIGKKGEFQEEFKNPFSLAIDIDGRIYVADVLNSRVQVFATTGAYLTQIGTFGFADGGVLRPNGVAVDSKKNVYISDVYLGVIYVFKPDGKFIAQVTNENETQKFTTPTRIKIYNNKLYVLEMLKNTLSVYDLVM